MKSCALFCAFFCGSGFVMGGSITYTTAFSTRSAPPVVPGFDASLGQLTEVDFAVTGSARGTWFTPTAVTSGTFTLFTGAHLADVAMGAVWDTQPFTELPAQNLLFLGDSFALAHVCTDALSPFYGPYPCNLILEFSAAVTDLEPTQLEVFGGLTGYDAVATVTYVYGAQVSEPSSLLMGSLVIGLLVLLRRRRLQ